MAELGVLLAAVSVPRASSPDGIVGPARARREAPRLCELVQAIYQRMEDSNFDMVDNDASAAAKDLGIAEMEELEVIFQSYRNPRLAHLRKFEHYQRLLLPSLAAQCNVQRWAAEPADGQYSCDEQQHPHRRPARCLRVRTRERRLRG